MKNDRFIDVEAQIIEEEIDRYGWFLQSRDLILSLYGDQHEVYKKMLKDEESWDRWFQKKNIDKKSIVFKDKKLKQLREAARTTDML